MTLHVSVMLRPKIKGIVWPSTIKRRVKRVLTHPEVKARVPKRASLCITLTNDQEVHALNRDYRGVDRPTDVLSFALQEGDDWILPPDAEHDLGDVVISVETAKKQAQRGVLPRLQETLGDRKWGISEEIYFLMLHGVLHLLGYDHVEELEAEEMEALEARLLPCLFGWSRDHTNSKN